MSSLNKRYVIASSITACLVIILLICSLFVCRKEMASKNHVHQNAEISLVTVYKKTPPKKKIEKKKAEKKPVPSENSMNKAEEKPEQQEEPEEESEEQEEISEEQAAANKKATSTYKEYVLSRISAKKVYPIQARTKGQTGRVKLHVVINPDGTLAALEITKPSEFQILNDAAVSAVQKAAPFKKMPQGLKPLDFSFLMDFSLK